MDNTWTKEIAEKVKAHFPDAIVEELTALYFDNGREVEEDQQSDEASAACYALYWKDPRFADIKMELETRIATYAACSEVVGFKTGFKYALELLTREGAAV